MSMSPLLVLVIPAKLILDSDRGAGIHFVVISILSKCPFYITKLIKNLSISGGQTTDDNRSAN